MAPKTQAEQIKQNHDVRNAIVGGSILALGAAGIFLWNANRDKGPIISPVPNPTPTYEATPTAKPTPADEGAQMPELSPLPSGYCWTMTKGGLFEKSQVTKYNADNCITPTPVATVSATPKK